MSTLRNKALFSSVVGQKKSKTIKYLVNTDCYVLQAKFLYGQCPYEIHPLSNFLFSKIFFYQINTSQVFVESLKGDGKTRIKTNALYWLK